MRRRADKGAATTILVVTMALVLVAATLLLSKIARANGLRTRAQTAADASALAAAAEIRDRGATDIARGLIPDGEIYLSSSAGAARDYAAKNGAVVDEVRASGYFGLTVKVTLHTRACQPKPGTDQAPMHFTCEHGERGLHGTATAIARVAFPACGPRGFHDGKKHGKGFIPPTIGIFCNGLQTRGFDAARRMFAVRLVDEEDPTAFDPDYTTRDRETGRQLADMYGWTGANWVCLDKLWTGESGWNHLAVNPTSGAYGIPQALPAVKMAKYGGDYLTNPVTQIRWGFDYISSVYGNPCAAYAFWLSHWPHWY
ncbi:pilus assembly protein TadG-related protein [Actinoallomurus sp. NPDC050550]|uniref:aggregation-promoting factor C-terminal-like domain-containing protein n=1 Tax=Actinoallomurus sp. NPDC050550 TaxID=3154937 RepID=UPI0033EB2233